MAVAWIVLVKKPASLAVWPSDDTCPLGGGASRGITPFPPDFVRVVPLLWLASCAMGWLLVVTALRFDTRKLRALAALILNVPNTLLAGILSLAAVMGD